MKKDNGELPNGLNDWSFMKAIAITAVTVIVAWNIATWLLHL